MESLCVVSLRDSGSGLVEYYIAEFADRKNMALIKSGPYATEQDAWDATDAKD